MFLKLDYNINSKDSLTFSSSVQFSSNNSPNLAQITAPFIVVNIPTHSKSGFGSIHYRHIFSPTMLNELVVGYAATFGPPDVTTEGLKGINRSTWGFNAGSLNPANNSLNLMPGMTFGGVVGGQPRLRRALSVQRSAQRLRPQRYAEQDGWRPHAEGRRLH